MAAHVWSLLLRSNGKNILPSVVTWVNSYMRQVKSLKSFMWHNQREAAPEPIEVATFHVNILAVCG